MREKEVNPITIIKKNPPFVELLNMAKKTKDTYDISIKGTITHNPL